jgi:putative NADH-flavin reductase
MENKSIRNIFVIGGTGRTGTILIEKLTKLGYNVTSVTRSDPTKCKNFGPNNKWIHCDVYENKQGNLTDLLKNHDAVISTLGGKSGSPKDLYYVSYLNVLNSMYDAGVKRLIMVTADGTHKQHGYFFKYVVKKLFLSSVLVDTEKTEDYIKNSYKGSVDWTIIRPFRLLDGEKGKYRAALEDQYPSDGKSWTWESFTGDVAQFCIDELTKNEYVKKLVSTGI